MNTNQDQCVSKQEMESFFNVLLTIQSGLTFIVDTSKIATFKYRKEVKALEKSPSEPGIKKSVS